MLTADFSFELPEELIAQEPCGKRGESRLMVLDRADGSIVHSRVSELPSFVPPRSVMVFNDTKVRRARIFARRLDPLPGVEPGGAEFEVLFVERSGARRWKVLSRSRALKKPGRRIALPLGVEAVTLDADGDLREIELSREVGEDWFEAAGRLPLPPYIRREDGLEDSERYQTVYSRTPGSVAAPTAGLHFTEAILGSLRAIGTEIEFVTLAVGLGTFAPVRAERVEEHRMHAEEYEVPAGTAEAVEAAKREGRKVVAVGTTSARSLESAWNGRGLERGPRATDIFIYPGKRFNAVDALFTNFHTPRSTLLMLVSAFAGKELIDEAYAVAVAERYRFFSYGDAMLIL